MPPNALGGAEVHTEDNSLTLGFWLAGVGPRLVSLGCRQHCILLRVLNSGEETVIQA